MTTTTPVEGPGARVLVGGLGNVLMGDDGFGPVAVERMKALLEPRAEVAVEDLGTPGLGLVTLLLGYQVVVLVDTVSLPGPPGTVRVFRHDELLRMPLGPRVNPHDPALGEALQAAALHPEGPREFVVIGAVPEHVDLGTELSPALQAALPRAIEAVQQVLRRLGLPLSPRPVPAASAGFWQGTVD